MEQYGIRQFYNNVKEDGLMSALKYDVKETIARHPKAAKGLATGLVLAALAGNAYGAGNGGYITDNRHIPEDSGTKQNWAGKTIDEQVKEYGAIGLLSGLVTLPFRVVPEAIVAVGETVSESKCVVDFPVRYVVKTLKGMYENKLETIAKAGATVAIADAGSGSTTSSGVVENYGD